MADLAPFLWGLGGSQVELISGTVTVEGDRVHMIASLQWTAFLSWIYNTDPIWLALPRDQFDAADNPDDFGFINGVGQIITNYSGYGDPLDGYYSGGWVTDWLTAGDTDFGGQIIRGDCYLFFTVPDEGAVGLPISTEIDWSWPNGPGSDFGGRLPGSLTPGADSAGQPQAGAVRSRHRRVRG